MRSPGSVVVGLFAAFAATGALAQGTSGENYSAGKTPAQLFNSDCTGSGCHSRPQGLAMGRSSGELTNYLREHYTNSRQSAAMLAGYLMSVGGTTRVARPERPEPPPERTERTGSGQRDWLQIPFPNLFGRQEEERPPAPVETPAPRPRQSARAPAKPPANVETPPRQDSRSEQDSSFLAPIWGLFSRDDAEKPAAQPEAPPRTRQSRQPPKPQQAARAPTEAPRQEPPQETEQGGVFSPLQSWFGREEPEKPAQTEPPARGRQARRPPPQGERAPKPPSDIVPPRDSVRQRPKTEERAKPPGDTRANIPARSQRAVRQPPNAEEGAKPPAHTRPEPARGRSSAPPLPTTEDNAGPPGVDGIYRPARRGQSESSTEDGANSTSAIGSSVSDERSAVRPQGQHIFD